MVLRAWSPADRPTSWARTMQLPQPTEIPELGGLLPSRLSALAERGGEARREIDALLGRARRRARGLALLPRLVLLAALGVTWLFQLTAPRRFALGLSRLQGGDAAAPAPELTPIVGDLTITYLYPQYTGLPARTEEGTAGDLRAPRGTEAHIAGRADRDLSEAVAVVNGKPVKLLSQGPGRRQLSGSLTLAQPGRWSFRFL